MRTILVERTRFITVVLENMAMSHNASAIVRTAECMGIQDVHIIENDNEYGINKKVLKGANKWLTIKRYNQLGQDNTITCLKQLREQGYTLVAADPDPDIPSIDDFQITQKTAVIMGSELNGLSEAANAYTDAKVRVPMFGFTESYNVSVSAALSLRTLITKVRQSKFNWHLSNKEQGDILLDWLRKSIKSSKQLEQKYLNTMERRVE